MNTDKETKEIKEISEAEVREALKKVIDPELGIDIVRLGLILNIEIGEFYPELNVHEYIKVEMTLTSPMCPFVDSIIQDVEDNINLLGKGEAQVELNFENPWQVPEDLRLELGV